MGTTNYVFEYCHNQIIKYSQFQKDFLKADTL